jgi:hypothetical protein
MLTKLNSCSLVPERVLEQRHIKIVASKSSKPSGAGAGNKEARLAFSERAVKSEEEVRGQRLEVSKRSY